MSNHTWFCPHGIEHGQGLANWCEDCYGRWDPHWGPYDLDLRLPQPIDPCEAFYA